MKGYMAAMAVLKIAGISKGRVATKVGRIDGQASWRELMTLMSRLYCRQTMLCTYARTMHPSSALLRACSQALLAICSSTVGLD
jgi:hypothetical protein